MKIGSLDTEKTVVVIAEIGNNHEGDFSRAQAMLSAAAQAGAHVVKFQTFIPDQYVNRFHDEARYQRLKRFQLSQDQFSSLAEQARREGVVFISTPFDLESAAFLAKIAPAFKIGSSENNFYPLLDVVAKTGKPVILSSGLTDIETIRASKSFLESKWREYGVVGELAVLHCVSSYPVQPQEANLGAITHLKKELGCEIGYSDHTLGIDAATIAVALGARIVEKHFTLDKNLSDFRDHQLSATPDEMRALVARIAEVEQYLGTGVKRVQKCEEPGLAAWRRSIVAKQDLAAGEVIRWEQLCWTRPAIGLPPGEEARVLGKKLKRAIPAGTPITEDLLG